MPNEKILINYRNMNQLSTKFDKNIFFTIFFVRFEE